MQTFNFICNLKRNFPLYRVDKITISSILTANTIYDQNKFINNFVISARMNKQSSVCITLQKKTIFNFFVLRKNTPLFVTLTQLCPVFQWNCIQCFAQQNVPSKRVPKNISCEQMISFIGYYFKENVYFSNSFHNNVFFFLLFLLVV